MNKIDKLFKSSLKSNEVKPSDNIWNNIEREILLKERNKEKRKIIFLRWYVAASIAMLFSLGAYMWVSRENVKLKEEQTLTNKEIVSSPEISNIQPASNDTKQLYSNKENYKTNEPVVESTTGGTTAQITINSRQVKAIDKKPVNKSLKSEEVKNVDKYNSIDPVAEILNKNIVELQSYSQVKKDSVVDVNNSSVANQEATKSPIDSLPVSVVSLIDSSSFKTVALNNPNKIEKPTSTWWIGGIYSPDFIFNFPDPVSKYRPKYSYTTGLQVGYLINEKWSVQTGVLFANKKEMRDYKEVDTAVAAAGVHPGNGNLLSSDEAHPNSLGIIIEKDHALNYQYKYFDVPLQLKNHIRKGRFNFFASAGLSAGFFFGYKVVAVSKNDGSRQTGAEYYLPFRSMTYSAIASAGMDYSVSKKISVNLEPTFRYVFRTRTFILSEYPCSLGLAMGFKYHF